MQKEKGKLIYILVSISFNWHFQHILHVAHILKVRNGSATIHGGKSTGNECLKIDLFHYGFVENRQTNTKNPVF